MKVLYPSANCNRATFNDLQWNEEGLGRGDEIPFAVIEAQGLFDTAYANYTVDWATFMVGPFTFSVQYFSKNSFAKNKAVLYVSGQHQRANDDIHGLLP